MRLLLGTATLLSSFLYAQAAEPGTAQNNPAAAVPEAPPFVNCPAGGPLGAVDLRVQTGDQSLPFRTINNLGEGDTLVYAPILTGKEKRPGDIALVLVPAKRHADEPDILVTDPKPADKPQSWKMSQTISVAALIYGPAGLNRKKVARFLAQDEVLVAQLADYADKTAQAERLVTTLSNSESSAASVNAALNGFASEYGFAVQIDRNAPVASQAAVVFAAMNPQLQAYNPLAGSGGSVAGQTASLATMAGTLFFGSPIGLAAGGTAMLLDLRAIAFPDTQFRASFAQPLSGSPSGVNLCGQQSPLPPHTRAAYIWASRVPNLAAPPIHIGSADFIPATQKTALPVDVPQPGWKYLDHAREWTLESSERKFKVPVVKLGNQKALEIDLTKIKIPPGDYKLTAFWDWTKLEANGVVHVRPLSDFKEARLDPASQDRMLAKSGKVAATLRGSDFEFTTKIELQKPNDEFATPENLRFKMPKGLREGLQDRLDVQIDTSDLDPGAYKLLISQLDGKSHAVDFKVLPNLPKIDNLPIVVNQGAIAQHFMLKGERLEEVSKLEAPGAVLDLGAPAADQTERSVTVKLKSLQQPGSQLPVKAYIDGRSEPLSFAHALEIIGPLPVITSSKLSLPAGIAIAVRGDEFPSGYTLNALLDVKNIDRKSVLRLGCADDAGQRVDLRIGEQGSGWSLTQLSADQLFLAFDTTGSPAGCVLQASIDNHSKGSSKPFTLAHILLVPRIDTFALSDAPGQNGARLYQLTGENLELIEKVGWDEQTGLEVSGLPVPLRGPGLKQSIQIGLPDPPNSEAVVYVWLRGDERGRATTIKAPPLPEPPSPVPQSPPTASPTTVLPDSSAPSSATQQNPASHPGQ